MTGKGILSTERAIQGLLGDRSRINVDEVCRALKLSVAQIHRVLENSDAMQVGHRKDDKMYITHKRQTVSVRCVLSKPNDDPGSPQDRKPPSWKKPRGSRRDRNGVWVPRATEFEDGPDCATKPGAKCDEGYGHGAAADRERAGPTEPKVDGKRDGHCRGTQEVEPEAPSAGSAVKVVDGVGKSADAGTPLPFLRNDPETSADPSPRPPDATLSTDPPPPPDATPTAKDAEAAPADPTGASGVISIKMTVTVAAVVSAPLPTEAAQDPDTPLTSGESPGAPATDKPDATKRCHGAADAADADRSRPPTEATAAPTDSAPGRRGPQVPSQPSSSSLHMGASAVGNAACAGPLRQPLPHAPHLWVARPGPDPCCQPTAWDGWRAHADKPVRNGRRHQPTAIPWDAHLPPMGHLPAPQAPPLAPGAPRHTPGATPMYDMGLLCGDAFGQPAPPSPWLFYGQQPDPSVPQEAPQFYGMAEPHAGACVVYCPYPEAAMWSHPSQPYPFPSGHCVPPAVRPHSSPTPCSPYCDACSSTCDFRTAVMQSIEAKRRRGEHATPRVFQAPEGRARDLQAPAFSVVTYNILLPIRATEFMYPYCGRDHLETWYRWANTASELTSYAADFVCLQECDTAYLAYFQQFQILSGSSEPYKPFYKQRQNNPDGCAILYKPCKWELVCDTTIRLCTPYKYNSDTDNVAIAAIFKAKDKKSTMVCIATVHLFWNPYYPEIKVTQTQQVLQSLHCFLQQHDMTHIPVVLAGDLNSTPNSPVYELISNDQGLALKSAYSTLSNAKVNAPTNYTPHFVDCIDYVFFSDHMLKPVSLLGEPASVDLYDNIALPNRFYSSDHIAVGTELIFDCSVTQDSSGM